MKVPSLRDSVVVIRRRVCVSTGSLSGPASTSAFEIIDRYPVEGREPMYRLFDTRERTERMVPESELSPVQAL